MALHEAPRRQADRHRGEDHRQQCGQAQEALRLIERVADFRTRIVDRFDGLAATQARLGPPAERGQRRFIARQLQVIADAAALLDQSGALEVLGVDHYPRQQAEEIRAAIRLETDHRARHEFELAQTHLVARLERQSGEQPFVEPGLATRRHARCQAVRLIRPGGDAQTAAQRIARLHRLDARKLGRLGSARHAGELGGGDEPEATRHRAVDDLRRPWMIRLEQQVAAQQLVGFAVQRLADTIGQEADAGETRHRDHEREGQQMKFAGTKIAQQHSKGEAQL